MDIINKLFEKKNFVNDSKIEINGDDIFKLNSKYIELKSQFDQFKITNQQSCL